MTRDAMVVPFAYILLLGTAECIDFRVKLDSLDVELIAEQPHPDTLRLRTRRESKEEEVLDLSPLVEGQNKSGDSEEQGRRTASNATEGCFYLYPQKKQYDEMLSNMMNELTQVFMKTNKWVSERERERGERQSRRRQAAADVRRAVGSRFQVAHSKRKLFFEQVYSNMTDNHNKFYNSTSELVFKADNPCKHQEEIKRQWQNLLEHSLETLKNAMQLCIEEYLKDQKILPESKLGKRVNKYLNKELQGLRSNQLKVLCEQFHVCYDDVTKEFKWKTSANNGT